MASIHINKKKELLKLMLNKAWPSVNIIKIFSSLVRQIQLKKITCTYNYTHIKHKYLQR